MTNYKGEGVFKAEGSRIDYTPPADVVAGEGVQLGGQTGIVGFATEDIPADTLGSLQVQGIFAVETDDTPALGDVMYWNDTTKKATTTVGTNATLGHCVGLKDAGNRVLINTRTK